MQKDNQGLHELIDECVSLGASIQSIQSYLEKVHYKLLVGKTTQKDWQQELLGIFKEIGEDSLSLFSVMDVMDMCKRDFPSKYRTMSQRVFIDRVLQLGYDTEINIKTGKLQFVKIEQ